MICDFHLFEESAYSVLISGIGNVDGVLQGQPVRKTVIFSWEPHDKITALDSHGNLLRLMVQKPKAMVFREKLLMDSITSHP